MTPPVLTRVVGIIEDTLADKGLGARIVLTVAEDRIITVVPINPGAAAMRISVGSDATIVVEVGAAIRLAFHPGRDPLPSTLTDFALIVAAVADGRVREKIKRYQGSIAASRGWLVTGHKTIKTRVRHATVSGLFLPAERLQYEPYQPGPRRVTTAQGRASVPLRTAGPAPAPPAVALPVPMRITMAVGWLMDHTGLGPTPTSRALVQHYRRWLNGVTVPERNPWSDGNRLGTLTAELLPVATLVLGLLAGSSLVLLLPAESVGGFLGATAAALTASAAVTAAFFAYAVRLGRHGLLRWHAATSAAWFTATMGCWLLMLLLVVTGA